MEKDNNSSSIHRIDRRFSGCLDQGPCAPYNSMTTTAEYNFTCYCMGVFKEIYVYIYVMTMKEDTYKLKRLIESRVLISKDAITDEEFNRAVYITGRDCCGYSETAAGPYEDLSIFELTR